MGKIRPMDFIIAMALFTCFNQKTFAFGGLLSDSAALPAATQSAPLHEVCSQSPNPDACSCSVNPESRVECGWPGISESTCKRRGCCFNSNWHGVKWCYKRVTVRDYCDVNPERRIEGGWAGISRLDCEAMGNNCFNSNTRGMKWCYEQVKVSMLHNGK